MNRVWYLSRNGHVFGPVTDEQLAQSVAEGRVFPTDQLNIAGQPHWWAASAIPGLLPPSAPTQEPELVPAAEIKSLRITCFACFREVTLEFEAGTPTAHCPRCRSAIETGETETPATATPQAAFAALESPKAFKARMQKKVADAHSGAKSDGAVIGGILGAIIQG